MPTFRKYAIRTASGWASMSPAEQAEYYGTYTTLSAWWAATQSLDLPTLDIINQAVCFDDWPTGLSSGVTVSGATVDATRYVEIVAAPGHGHGGIPESGFRVVANVGGTGAVILSSQYTRVSGFSIQNTAASANNALRVLAANCVADRMILRSDTFAAFAAASPGSGYTVSNTLLHGSVRGTYLNKPGGFFNVIAANCSLYGFVASSGSNPVLLKNCTAYNCGTPYDMGILLDPDSSNNASDTGTPPGSNPITGITSAAFANVAANDFHLSGTGSVLYHAGVPVAGVEYDIDGDPYDVTTPSVGFDEVVAGGGSTQLSSVTSAATATVIISVISQLHQLSAVAVAATSAVVSGAITSAHQLAAADVAAAASVTAGALTQTHQLDTASIAAAGTVTAAAATQTHALTAADVAAAASVVVNPLSQGGIGLSAADVAAAASVTAGALTQTHQLIGADVVAQANADAVAIAQAHGLLALSAYADGVTDAGGITQVHVLSGIDVAAGASVATGSSATGSLGDVINPSLRNLTVRRALQNKTVKLTLRPH